MMPVKARVLNRHEGLRRHFRHAALVKQRAPRAQLVRKTAVPIIDERGLRGRADLIQIKLLPRPRPRQQQERRSQKRRRRAQYDADPSFHAVHLPFLQYVRSARPQNCQKLFVDNATEYYYNKCITSMEE